MECQRELKECFFFFYSLALHQYRGSYVLPSGTQGRAGTVYFYVN